MVSTRRAWSVAGLSSTAALAAAAGGASWYYASRLTEPPVDLAVAEPVALDLVEVVAVLDDRVVLRGPDAARPGRWGLDQLDDDLAGGYAQAGEVLTEGDDTVTRALTTLTGRLEPGTARLDGYAWPPIGETLAPPAHEVTYESGVGPAPAWFVPGDAPTWVIVVHGRSAQRHEGFRYVSTFARLGHPVLMISYRNDRDAPRSPDNRSHLGHTEWQDVEAAVEHALAHGARDVVLMGCSMGGACVVQCTRRSDRAGRVRALVLDAPVLDWGPVVRRAALDRGLPRAVVPALLPLAMGVARLRVGIDFADLRSDPAALELPTLLLHGDADPVVPVELSDTLAAARPDVVTYLRVPGAGHVRSWNHAPDHVDMAIGAFLEAVT